MQVGTVQKLITIFSQSFRELEIVVSLGKLESLSIMIHRAMTVQTRNFHNLEHVFNFVDPNNAVVSLAALYHDIVYYQVDMGFSPQIRELISPYIVQDGEDFYIQQLIDPADTLFYLTLDIFALHPGQKLSSVAALNEFLSAVVMNKELGQIVSIEKLALMTICIEATIPFRGFSADGKNHFDRLETRLPDVIKNHQLNISSEELIEGIKTAVLFANKDIENFAEADPGQFLDITWKLLPETNAALRIPDVYTMGAYREALHKMKLFFDNLNAETVFNQFQGVPSNEEYEKMSDIARNNIHVARQYLGIMILGTAILEALALETGGDAPLSLFMGDVPREGVTIKRLEYFLPEIEDSSWVDQNSALFKLLESGRANETAFDMKNSPLSLFIYRAIAPDQINIHLHNAQEFFDHKISPAEFLMRIDPFLLKSVARASSIMVFTRRSGLLKFAGEE
ncbi:MAG: hypothetical protein WCP19_06560 [Chloroflexota bacterium]